MHTTEAEWIKITHVQAFHYHALFHFRYPTTMMFAQCECTQCIEGNRFSLTNNCRPVYAKVKVLTRAEGCHMGRYWYVLLFSEIVGLFIPCLFTQ